MNDLVFPRQSISPSGKIMHVGVRAILRAAPDSYIPPMAKLIDVVFDAPVLAGLPDQVRAHFAGNDLIGPAAPPSAIGVPSKSTNMASPMESKVPSEPHMHTLAVCMRLVKELTWLVIFHEWRIGAV